MSNRITEDTFHQRLIELIEDLDMSLTEVGSLVGVQYLAVHRWVNRKSVPKVSERGQILEILEEEIREKILDDYENVVRLMRRWMPDRVPEELNV